MRRNVSLQHVSEVRRVFLGQVIADEPQMGGSIRTRFQVKERFKNATENEVVVFFLADTMWGGGSPEPLEKGAQYLVFASKDRQEKLVADHCAQPIPLALADSDLHFLRDLQSGNAPKTILYGTIRRVLDAEHITPLSTATVEASGPAGSFQTNTDNNGSFQFRDIPPGEYRLTAALPDTETVRADRSFVNVKSEGCASTELLVMWNGRISGRATQSNGQPVKDVDVSLFLEGQDLTQRMVEKTDSDGRFAFEQLWPGRYKVSVFGMEGPGDDYPFPPLFYAQALTSDRADVIELAAGQQFDRANFVIPDFFPRLLQIQVVWPDQHPASGAHVIIEYADSICWLTHCLFSFYETHEDGHVRINTYGDGKVRVYATASHGPDEPWISESQELDLTKLPVATTLIVSHPDR
jgi:hypothetical protein